MFWHFGLEASEKDFIDDFGRVPGCYYQRKSHGWSSNWTDEKLIIKIDFRLLFDAVLKTLSQLLDYAIVGIPEWTSSDAYRC